MLFSEENATLKMEYGKPSQKLSKSFFDLPESICKKRCDSFYL